MKRNDPELLAMGSRVRARRRALGWSLERFGQETGLHWSYLGEVERGERNIGYLNLVRVAKALGVSVTTLVADA